MLLKAVKPVVGFYLQDVKIWQKNDNDTEAIKICSNVCGSHSVINLTGENKQVVEIHYWSKVMNEYCIHQGQSKW